MTGSDLAESGKAALAQVEEHRYDLIILDVMMPDMDGFEVCGKIRETTTNRLTPVLFVTSLKDFDARARSLSTGGTDLVGKPFLTFEIAVKALTLVLRARLREDRERICEASVGSDSTGTPSVRWPESRPVPEPEEHPVPPAELLEVLNRPAGRAGMETLVMLPPPPFAATVAVSEGVRQAVRNVSREFSPAFLRYMEAILREMKHQITLIGGMEDGVARQRNTRAAALAAPVALAQNKPFRNCGRPFKCAARWKGCARNSRANIPKK